MVTIKMSSDEATILVSILESAFEVSKQTMKGDPYRAMTAGYIYRLIKITKDSIQRGDVKNEARADA